MKTVFIDIDNTIGDFDRAVGREDYEWNPPEMFEPDFFRNIPVMPGAQWAVSRLLMHPNIDLYIASKPTLDNINSTIHKYQWIMEHFPSLKDRIMLTCDKGLLHGDYLIDDDHERWAHKFKGTFIHFNKKDPLNQWTEIVRGFMTRYPE